MNRPAAHIVWLSFLLLSFATAATAQPLSLTTNTVPPSCGIPNGIIFASATGGTPPYTYSFNGISVNTGYFPNAHPGAIPSALPMPPGQRPAPS